MHWCREFGKGVCIDGNVEKEASAIGRLPGGRVRLKADDLTGAVRLDFTFQPASCLCGWTEAHRKESDKEYRGYTVDTATGK